MSSASLFAPIVVASCCSLAALAGGAFAAEPPSASPGAALADVFVSGAGGYHTYRIPSLLATPKGTLLAFCEGRKRGTSDTGDIDLLLKRSRDGGRTWGEGKVVWDDGPNTCGNPCPVVDERTGAIWLLLTHNLGSDGEAAIVGGTSRGSRTVWVARSDDDGETWSRPAEITASTKKPEWTWYATGPGVGIQLRRGPHRGRLVIPCDHKEAGTKKTFSHVIWSDDGGKSWVLGGGPASDGVNECQVIERADGTLLLNMRCYDRDRKRRAAATSADGGATWSALEFPEELIEPVCQASLIRYRPPDAAGRPIVLFSNPADTGKRIRMTVRASADDGRTWPFARLLHEGPSAYSSLAVIPGGEIGCLFEAGTSRNYERIVFARLTLESLLGAETGESRK